MTATLSPFSILLDSLSHRETWYLGTDRPHHNPLSAGIADAVTERYEYMVSHDSKNPRGVVYHRMQVDRLGRLAAMCHTGPGRTANVEFTHNIGEGGVACRWCHLQTCPEA